MKKRYQNVNFDSELSPDLEWMLQGKQVSSSLLLETLVEVYYQPIFRLVLSLLDDVQAARRTARQIFLSAIRAGHSYHSDQLVEDWLDTIAWKHVLKAYQVESAWRRFENRFSLHGDFTHYDPAKPDSPFDEKVWVVLDAFSPRMRFYMILNLAHGWSEEKIATAAKTSLAQVRMELEQASRIMVAELNSFDGDDGRVLEQAKNAIQARWTDIEAHPEDLEPFVRKLESQAARNRLQRSSAATFRELVVLAIAMVLVILLIWGGNQFFLAPQPTPAQTPVPGADSQEIGFNYRPEPASTTTPHFLADSLPNMDEPLLSSATSTPTGYFYIAQQNDTWHSVAAALGVFSKDTLRELNRVPDGQELHPGDQLLIPGRMKIQAATRATPVTPSVRDESTGEPQNKDEIISLMHMKDDHRSFNTIWFDASIYMYPNGDLEKMPQISRAQVWVSLNQYLMLGGPNGNQPAVVLLGNNGQYPDIARVGKGNRWFEPMDWIGSDQSEEVLTLLNGLFLIFQDSDEISHSKLEMIGESSVAARPVWIVSQSNSKNERLAVLWLDKATGLILRNRRYKPLVSIGPDNTRAPGEVIVNAIFLDQDFPQELFNPAIPWRGGYANNVSGAAIAADAPVFSPDTPEAVEQSDFRRPPDGYDLPQSRLSFRFPASQSLFPSWLNTQIFADGYFWGSVNLGIPWNIWCQRSRDGNLIAYSYPGATGDPVYARSAVLYYFYLDQPGTIYPASELEGVTGSEFALSPDNRSLAYWGCDADDHNCGVYIHDTSAHSSALLALLSQGASGFAWSPDGAYLAMLTPVNGFLVYEIRDKTLAYKGPYEPQKKAVPPDSPTFEWEIQFPPKMTGLEGCITPPAS